MLFADLKPALISISTSFGSTICCGVPLLVFSGVGVGVLLTWGTDSLQPIAGVLLLAALVVWGR